MCVLLHFTVCIHYWYWFLHLIAVCNTYVMYSVSLLYTRLVRQVVQLESAVTTIMSKMDAVMGKLGLQSTKKGSIGKGQSDVSNFIFSHLYSVFARFNKKN